MALIDNVFFNTRERAISTDINNLESLAGRNLLESLRWMIATQNDPASVGTPGTAASNPRSVVVGGLQAAAAGNDLAVSPGVLFQESATLSPLPGAFDSPYRFGRLATTEIITMPSPGVDTFYLLEAQIVQVLTSSQSRDIFNVGTQTFVPTVVPKEYEFQIQFQLLTGGSAFPTPSGGDWVVIAGIRRPGGGGPVLGSDIYDLAMRWSDYTPAQQRVTPVSPASTPLFLSAPYLKTVFEPGNAASNLIIGSAMVQYRGLSFMYRTPAAGIDVTSAQYLEPGVVLAADTWYYLYLMPYNGQLPRSSYGAGFMHQGVIVLRATPPVNSGASGSSLLPNPWGGASTNGVCVGAILRNDTNTGWRWQTTTGDTQICQGHDAYSANVGSTRVSANLNAGVPPSSLPLPSARSWLFDFEAQPISPASGSRNLLFSRNLTPATVFYRGANQDEAAWAAASLEVPSDFGTTIALEQSGASGSSLVSGIFKAFKWWGSR